MVLLNRWLHGSLATALFTVAPLLLGSSPQADTRSGSVQGSVIEISANDPSERKAVRRARVALRVGDSTLQDVETDIDGRFAFQAVPAGLYSIEARKAGLFQPGGSATVRVATGQHLPVIITLAKGGVVSGSVRLPSGRSADAVTVAAARTSLWNAEKTLQVVAEARADDTGAFRLHSLPPGRYVIRAGYDWAQVMNVSPADERRKVAHTFFPGTLDFGLAGSIDLGIGSEATIEMTLSPTIHTIVKGLVRTSTGDSPTAMGVAIERLDRTPDRMACELHERGRFECFSVPPVPVRLMISAVPQALAPTEYGVMPIADPLNAASVVVHTIPGAAVEGRIEWMGKSSSTTQVDVSAIETDYRFPLADPSRLGRSSSNSTRTDPDGSFRFASLFGPRLFRLASMPAGWAIAEVRVNGSDVTDTAVEIGAGQPTTGLTIRMTSATSTISGTVLALRDSGVAGQRVVAFVDDPRHWFKGSRFVRTANVEHDAQYSIDGLLPGRYYLAVVDPIEFATYPSVLSGLIASSTAFTSTPYDNIRLDIPRQRRDVGRAVILAVRGPR